nr:hypothetical protein [Pantoea coffeiphila]
MKAAQHEQAVNWEAATSLAEENGELKRQLEAAQRYRDEYAEIERRTAVRNTTLTDENYGLRAELKRRNDAVPVAWVLHARGGDQLTQDGGYVANAEGISGIGSTPLYASAPAAVFPPDNVTYFAFSPDYGFDFFKNKQDAINTAQEEIDGYREDRDDGWDEDVRRVAWGVVVQQAQGFDAQGKHYNHSEHTYQTCEYRLDPPLPGGGDAN